MRFVPALELVVVFFSARVEKMELGGLKEGQQSLGNLP